MRTRTLVALTVLGSVLASAAVVTAVRVIQHLRDSKFEQVPVTVNLPGASARPRGVVFALHANTLVQDRATVTARTHATGLLLATADDGTPVGESIVPRDPLLRRSSVTVNYQTTACSLVLETPALVTSSPLLATLVLSECHRSPRVATLAAVLRSESATRSDYLVYPDGRLLAVLRSAVADVSHRVASDFAPGQQVLASGASPPAAQRSASTPTARLPPHRPSQRSPQRPSERPSQRPTQRPPQRPSQRPTQRPVPLAPVGGASGTALSVATQAPAGAASPGPPIPPLADQIVLRDTGGNTACSTHSVSDALCLEHTYPLSPEDSKLWATDWSAGWQMLFLSRQLEPDRAGFGLPFALLPPVVNAPPTIAGLITTAISAGVLQAPKTCYKIKAQVVGECSKPHVVEDVEQELLKQLTLAGQSDAVRLDLTSELEHDPISAVGFGVKPGLGVSDTERYAWGASLVLTIATELVVPTIQLVLDVRGRLKAKEGQSGHAESSAPEAVGARKKAFTKVREIGQLRDEAGRLQREVDDHKVRTEAQQKAQQVLDTAKHDLDEAKGKLAAAQDKYLTAQADLDRAQASRRATPQQKRSVRSLKGWRTRRAKAVKAAHGKLDSANTALQNAQQHDANQLKDLQAKLHAKEDEVKRKRAELRHEEISAGLEPIATDTNSLTAVLAAASLQIAHHDRDQIVCAYHAIRARNNSVAGTCLKQVIKDVEGYAPTLIPLATNEAKQYEAGFAVGALVYSLPVVGEIDLGLNAVGVAQDIVDVYNTAKIPYRHDFPAISTNYRHGDKENQVAKLVLAAVRGQLLRNPKMLTAAVAADRLTGHQTLFATQTTTVCPDTVIVPDASVEGRVVGILNYSNLRDLHLAAGFGGIKRTTPLDQAVTFAAVKSSTPLGSGGASFGDPPGVGQTVHVVDEGSGLDYRTFDGHVSQGIPDQGYPMVLFVDPDAGPTLARERGVGGLVFATTGRNAGELVGLVEGEHDGHLVVLTGAGVEDLIKNICEEGPR